MIARYEIFDRSKERNIRVRFKKNQMHLHRSGASLRSRRKKSRKKMNTVVHSLFLAFTEFEIQPAPIARLALFNNDKFLEGRR